METMLILTRKKGEVFYIGEDITIAVLGVHGGQVRIGIDAPESINIARKELIDGSSVDDQITDEHYVELTTHSKTSETLKKPIKRKWSYSAQKNKNGQVNENY